MRRFESLTRRGQARRLRACATAALARYPVEPVSMRLVFCEANATFAVTTRAGDRHALRVGPPHTGGIDALRAEVDVVHWLSSTDVPVPSIVPARDGERVVEVEVPGVPGSRRCVLFGWLPGPMLADRLGPDVVVAWGALLARLHERGRGFIPGPGVTLPVADDVFDGVPEVLFGREHRATLSPGLRRDMRRLRDRARGILRALGTLPPTILHGDLHPWNIKLHRGVLRPYDFEYVRRGHPLQDVAISLYYLHRVDEEGRFAPAFVDGYRRVAPWPEPRRGQLATLVAARGLLLLNECLASPDPHVRAHAPALARRLPETIARARERFG